MKEPPAISVIIPMYNAEKYVSDCLDSLLAQTFQDFEVIIVDDCSTDKSVKVVKNYAPKFDGRLILKRTKRNSGCCAVPRNVGLPFSNGEYLFFLDADDAVTSTAFEELYSIAKKFEADVVACEKYYSVPNEFWNDKAFLQNLKPFSYQTAEFVDKPTLISDNLVERVQRFIQKSLIWNVWVKLIRRDLVLDNNITFAGILLEDMIFTACLMFTAKRFVLAPNVINYYRVVEGSLTHNWDRGAEFFRRYVRALTTNFEYFDRFLSGREFFRQHPDLKYLALKRLWDEISNYILDMYGEVSVHEFDEILREEFSRGDNLALSAFAFNAANMHHFLLIQNLKRTEELEKVNREQTAYIAELEKFAIQSQKHVAELENEIRRLKSKE